VAEIFAICIRAVWGGSSPRALEGATLFLAAGAYSRTCLFAHHDDRRELLTRLILVGALAL
jgi:hypothetical protein